MLLPRRLAVMALGLALALSGAAAAAAETITVFAAASMKTALDEAVAAYGTATGRRVVVSYAASSALAKQIEQGAPADLFVSADLAWMDYLAARGHIEPASRIDLLGNALVVVAPRESALQRLDLTPAGFAAALGGGRWATGLVDSVPAGVYARQALTSLGLWPVAEPGLAQAENVRAALAYVARGEVAFGIVYATDARAEPKVKVVAAIPPSSHEPIIYPVALTRPARSDEAAAAASQFLAFLRGPEARLIFERQGFTALLP